MIHIRFYEFCSLNNFESRSTVIVLHYVKFQLYQGLTLVYVPANVNRPQD